MTSTNTPVQRPWYILGEYVSMVTCFNVKVKSKSYISTHCVSSTLNKSWDHIKMKKLPCQKLFRDSHNFYLMQWFYATSKAKKHPFSVSAKNTILLSSLIKIATRWQKYGSRYIEYTGKRSSDCNLVVKRNLIQDSLTDIGTFVIHVGRNERIFFKA